MTVGELILREEDGTLMFGDHHLEVKSKVENFEHEGDIYKVKTFYEITKLEKNGMFVYESVPGTTVRRFQRKEDGVVFRAEGAADAQITLGLDEEKEYKIYIDSVQLGKMKTGLSGKLTINLELGDGITKMVEIIEA